MTGLNLHDIPGDDQDLQRALAGSGLPTDDLTDAGRTFFRATSEDGDTIGYAGIETCGDDTLLRSVVILPDHRGHRLGGQVVRKVLEMTDDRSSVYLATTSAAPFFENLGFIAVDRAEVPASVLSTRQLSSICPASATIMKLHKPPT